jgi:hypothetical protein
MKPDESRTPSKHRHGQEHAATVIHDPEQGMNLLERKLRHLMDNQTRFWGLLIGLVVVMVGLSLLASGLPLGRASSNEAWTKLESAKSAEEREEIARDFPQSPAKQSALLLAAAEYYMRGFSELPANKEVALPLLKKALDRFQAVADEAPPKSPQARAAALGVARTHEARYELDKAVAQYEKVAGNPAWKETAEATEAARLAALLKKPGTVAFYKDLYTFKPVEATLPAGGTGALTMPPIGSSPATIPGLDDLLSAPIKQPDPLLVPPPPTPAPKAPPTAPMTIDLSTAPKAKTEPAAPKTGAAAPKPAPGDALPADPFAPGKK